MQGQINKLFLLGNGFDLAHGLKTHYKDFIDNLWESEKQKILSSNDFVYSSNDGSYTYNDDILQIRSPKIVSTLPEDCISQNFKGHEWFKCLASSEASSKWHFAGSRSSKVEMSIKNIFLKNISEILFLQRIKWVDIENEYYRVLKNCFKIQIENTKSKEYYSFRIWR